MHRLRCSGIFDLVTLTLKFDLLLKNLTLAAIYWWLPPIKLCRLLTTLINEWPYHILLYNNCLFTDNKPVMDTFKRQKIKIHATYLRVVRSYLTIPYNCGAVLSLLLLEWSSNFLCPGLKGPSGASSNRIICLSVCPSVRKSVHPSRLQTKCNI